MRNFKVGIIGCGRIFPMHAYSLKTREDVEIVALCDIKEDRVQHWSKKFNARAYQDYEVMLKEEELDVVHICTPHHLHAEMMIKSMQAGVDVVCEKPATIDQKSFNEVMQVKKTSGQEVAISFQTRFNPASLAIKQVIEADVLGELQGARAYLAWNRSDEYYGDSDWKGTWDKEGGGVLIDQAIHTLDLMNWFINREFVRLDINMGRRGHSQIEVEDYVDGLIEYEGSLLAQINFVNHYVVDAPIEVEMIFEKGQIKLIGDTAHIDYGDGRKEEVARNPQEQFEIEGAKQYWGVGHKAFINHVYDRLANNQRIETNSLEDVERIHELVFSIYEEGKKNFKVKQ